MKFTTSLLLSLSSFAFRQVTANFHITKIILSDHSSSYWACPSNYWNCNCFAFGERSAAVEDGSSAGFFRLASGLCGMGELDFYENSDKSWTFYVHNGDGSVQGTCYSNTALHVCPLEGVEAQDQLVCYSYICN
jgi:hypothetical protein